jgi:sulfide:quinone oxidoreductase
MKHRVVVLGAGFGGLELTTILSDSLGDSVDVLLIDKAECFVFGFSKLDAMFWRQPPKAVQHPYRAIAKPGVRFLQTVVREIDPAGKRVVTDAGAFDADILVVALGADYDLAATPGLVEEGTEFYSVAGALALRDVLPRFEGGPSSSESPGSRSSVRPPRARRLFSCTTSWRSGAGAKRPTSRW